MWKIIDIGGDEYFLHVKHDCLSADKNGKNILTASFTDIHSIICHGGRITYSDEFIRKCINHKIPIIFCDSTHIPSGMLLPFLQHVDSADRITLQIKATQAQKKQSWKQIIQEKLFNQSQHLIAQGLLQEGEKIQILSKSVCSGDTGNCEAIGAQIYFSVIFGNRFSRKQINLINGILNYGYTIIRSCIARAVTGSGLYPIFGVFHSNKQNPFCLIDDLMEPIRPLVDMYASKLAKNNTEIDELSPLLKKNIIGIINHTVEFGNQEQELSFAIQNYIRSYIHFLEKRENCLMFPKYNYDFKI